MKWDRSYLKGMNVSVLGLGRSGLAAANWLARQGAVVVASDSRKEEDLPLKELHSEITLISGKNKVVPGSLVVISPGIPPGSPAFIEAHTLGGEVISDIELFYRLCPCPIAGITGTDGKSTTTALLAHILSKARKKVVLAGNIGHAVMNHLDGLEAHHWAVLEISCFQLIHCSSLHPRVAIFTNIAQDHIDYHGSFLAYVEAKKRLFARMGQGDAVVLNMDDDILTSFLLPEGIDCLGFSLRHDSRTDLRAFFKEGGLYLLEEGKSHLLARAEELKIIGLHNVQNALAAALAARAVGLEHSQIRSGILDFPGLEHRMELVAEEGGVKWFNDSKATNPHAASSVLKALDGQVVLIAGGSEKGSDFTELGALMGQKTKAVVLNGPTSPRMAQSLPPGHPVYMEANLSEAIKRAAGIAAPGDMVVLAPACASFDQFKDFEERGRVFKELVLLMLQEKNDQSSGEAR